MTVLTSLLFLLWVGIAVSAGADLRKRIIGGQDCAPQQHNYHVKLIDIHGELICGGSLISQWWILTSAHCWTWGLKVILGVHPGPGQLVIVKDPPQIYVDVNNDYHDIMLLRLPQRTLRPTSGFPPPNCASPAVGGRLETAGFASMTTGPNLRREQNEAINLQCAEITVDGNVKRNKTPYNKYPGPRFISNSIAVDLSPGDSGGGVEYQGAIYGLNTQIRNSSYALSGYSIFADVCFYRDWINDTIVNYKPLFG